MTTIFRPDGTATATLVMRTNTETVSLRGTAPPGTVYVEAVWNGVVSTTLVSLDGAGSFAFPDPETYPAGYPLEMGENSLTLTPYGAGAVPLDGPATATIERAIPSTVYAQPSGVELERRDGYVRVRARAPEGATAFYVYASTQPGGRGAGYFRVTAQPITVSETVTTETPFATTSATLPTPEGAATLRTLVTVLDEAGETIGTVLDADVEYPASVTELGYGGTLSSRVTEQLFHFDHDRNASRGDAANTVFFAALTVDSTVPLYYVTTALYYDAATGEQYESPYSAEVSGTPTNIRGGAATLPSVSRSQILETMILDLYSADPSLNLSPGATVRDTFLDPAAGEAERCRFLLDFIYRSTDLDSLVAIDDPQGLGVSSNPETSSYKTALARALYLENVTDVQAVINGAFDRIGRRFGIPREPAKRAVGEVLWSTSEAPSGTLVIAFGSRVTGGSVEFRTTRDVSLSRSQLASAFDPSLNAYVIRAPVEATVPGAAGNLERGALRGSGVYRLAVTNPAPTFGGSDAQTNTEYAAAIRRGAAGPDVNTLGGYARLAAAVAGVYAAEVVDAGSPMMFRGDVAPVDVWVRGTIPTVVTEAFAFQYRERRGALFEVVGDPVDGRFRSADPTLSVGNPLAAMLDYQSLGLGLKNATTGQWYDLTGVAYPRFDTIQLDTAIAQPPTTLSDLVIGDYRYSEGEDYELASQPVLDVYEVEGEVTGTLDPSLFDLRRVSPGLTYGSTTEAGDRLMFRTTEDPAVIEPSGAPIAVTGELHLMRGESIEYLVYLGADPYTVVVQNTTATITYAGPGSTTPDYEFVYGDARTPLGLRRTSTSTIPSGGAVQVAYSHRENFSVRYSSDLAVQKAQESVSTAGGQSTSVLARGSYAVPVDLEMTVEFQAGGNRAAVARAIQDQISYPFQLKGLGGFMVESEIVRRVAGAHPEVVEVKVPLTFFGRADRAPVMYDARVVASATRVDAWSNRTASVWVLEQGLVASPHPFPTPRFLRAGWVDKAPLVVCTTEADLRAGPGRVLLVPSTGIAPPGLGRRYSQVALVSLGPGEDPFGRRYVFSYDAARTRARAGRVDVGGMEYPVLGALTVTLVEAEDGSGVS